MVSVAELLNPEPPRAPLPTSRPVPASSAHRTVAFRNEPASARSSVETFRMPDHSKTPSRCKTKGAINFPPFEVLDDASLREVRRFQIRPFGSIQETCERIPYNSGKKDFFSKTGREGFEAFHYDFKVPGDDANYTVMWDYNVGLVRMTSFFKCRGYTKTTPAKMLNLNPGLKEITYSITGGSIKAQGYWMPFSCARAICATFCHEIAGALIPLFGPRFPFECIPDKAPGHGVMIINPEIVARAKSETAALFRPPANLPSPRPSRSLSPLPSHRPARVPEPYHYHSDYDRRMLLSPYTDTDVDYYPTPESSSRAGYLPMPSPRNPTSRPPAAPAAAPTPLHSPGWTAVNHPPPPPPHRIHPSYHHCAVSHINEELLGLNVSATANPWLSAIPRSPTPSAGSTSKWQAYHPRSHHYHHHPYQTPSTPASLPERGITLPPLRLKRSFDQVDAPGTNPEPKNNNTDHDDNYDASASASPSSITVGTNGPLVRAPPSTPASPTSPTSTRAIKLSQSAPPSPTRPAPGIVTPPNNSNNSFDTNNADDDDDGDDDKDKTKTKPKPPNPAGPRWASERDAAIMLMHMHMRGTRDGDGGGSASNGSDADADADSNPDEDDKKREKEKKNKKNGRPSPLSPVAEHGGGGGRGGDNESGGAAGPARGRRDSASIVVLAAPRAAVVPVVVEGRGVRDGEGEGRRTRSKRRRTWGRE